MNYRKRYNLDSVLKEFERDNGPLPEESTEDKIEIEDSNNDNSNDVICLSPSPPKKEFKSNNKLSVGSNANSKW